MDAISRGKHVYVQKPMTHTIREARELTLAARRHGVATQMGNQHHASVGPRVLAECLQADAIGEVHEVHIWTNRPTSWGVDAGTGRPAGQPPVPDSLDWNLWLGTAPYRPYHPAYLPKKWRTWWDFGTGALGDMGCHLIDAPYWILELGWPDWVEAECSPVNNETIPKWSVITYQFPARNGRPPVKMLWYDGGKMPERPKELENGRNMSSVSGQIYYGEKGTVLSDGYSESWRIIPETKMRAFLKNKPPETLPRSPGHVKEWVNACKGGPPAMSNFDYAGRLTEVVLLGNLAIRSGKRIKVDQETLEVTNHPEANKYITHPYRDY